MGIRRILAFIPGNSPSMIGNAPIMDADTIVFDLEDSIPFSNKADARMLVRGALQSLNLAPREVAVRINGIKTPFWEEDLEQIVPCCPAFIQLPKAESRADILLPLERIEAIERRNGIPVGTVLLGPIIETALGVENAFEIASTETARLAGLFLGGEDLATDLGGIRTAGGEEILYARQRLVNAARAAGLSPSDTAYIQVNDDEGLIADCKRSRTLGFDGRAVVSPRQIALARSLYLPSEEEIALAHQIMSAYKAASKYGRGAVTLHGRMIDEPIIRRAQALLESVGEEGLAI